MQNFNLAEIERDVVIVSLWRNKGNRNLAAKDLGISRSTLFEKIKVYELDGEIVPCRQWFGFEKPMEH